jgi:hypothetical protein
VIPNVIENCLVKADIKGISGDERKREDANAAAAAATTTTTPNTTVVFQDL